MPPPINWVAVKRACRAADVFTAAEFEERYGLRMSDLTPEVALRRVQQGEALYAIPDMACPLNAQTRTFIEKRYAARRKV